MPRPLRLAPLAFVALAACKDDPPTAVPPVDCVATDAARPVTTLAVGEVKVLSGSAVNCVRLVSDAAAATYLAVVSHVGATPDQLAEYRLGVDAPAFAGTAGDVAAAERRLRLAGNLTAAPRMHDAHERLLAEARKLDLGAARAARAAEGARPAGIRGAIFPTGVAPSLGQTAQIRIPSLESGARPCDQFSTITATVRHVSQRAVIMQDNASPANGFTDGDFAAIGAEFDDLIFATDTAYFGRGSDVDANAGRIVILYTPEVNKATPRGTNQLLAGFFWAGDLFPRTGSNACSQSNGSELFYLLVPDPTGIHSTARQVADVREKTRGTVAHEFQHMLNAGSRLNNPAAADFEDVWLDEALAHFAEEMVGRARRGYTDIQELRQADVFDSANEGRDYEAFFFQNVARLEDWLRAPSDKAPISEQADSSLAVRGAAWALLRYTADHYSGGDVRAYIRRLAAGPQVGVANFTSKLPSGTTLEQVLTGWHVANYADNLGIPGLPVRYTYRSWHIREVVAAQTLDRTYPLRPTTVANDGTVARSVRSGGGAGFYLFPIPAGQQGALQLTNAQGTAAGFEGGRLVLLRTQ